MKRSKAIEFIAEELLTNDTTFGGDKEEQEEVRVSNRMYRLRLAKKALEAVEKMGMSPPKAVFVKTLYGNVWGTTEVNEWEEE